MYHVKENDVLDNNGYPLLGGLTKQAVVPAAAAAVPYVIAGLKWMGALAASYAGFQGLAHLQNKLCAQDPQEGAYPYAYAPPYMAVEVPTTTPTTPSGTAPNTASQKTDWTPYALGAAGLGAAGLGAYSILKSRKKRKPQRRTVDPVLDLNDTDHVSGGAYHD